MRTLNNPIKANPNIPGYKRHRIIMPVYVPSLTGYYQDAFKIFSVCLDSLLQTIDRDQVNITIINNGSIQLVDSLIKEKMKDGLIDQYVNNNSNRGKADAIVGAAKSCYEPFITFTDADVLFYPGWLNEVEKIFNTFQRAGAVSPFPTPNLKFTFTSSAWLDKFFSIKKGKIVSEEHLRSFEKSIGISGFFKNRDYNEQYYLSSGGNRALIGAGHFVCTYRQRIFRTLEYEPTHMGLKGGLKRIDEHVDVCGLYRLSLPVPFVLHMGNVFSEDYKPIFNSHEGRISHTEINGGRFTKPLIPFGIRKKLFFAVLALYKIGLR